MRDYNDSKLPDPCLRLDYGLGSEWASIELGDGTGYVRLSELHERDSIIAEMCHLILKFDMPSAEINRRASELLERASELLGEEAVWFG